MLKQMSYSAEIKKCAAEMKKKGTLLIQIAKELKIAKSTASEWVRDIELPDELKKYLTQNSLKGREKGLKIMKAKREIEQMKIEKEARNILSAINLKDKNLTQLIAATVFWCEGNKIKLSTLGFTNSDPNLIKLFLHCIRSGFEIDEKKLRALVHIHDYHDNKKQQKFWSQITGIPLAQFNKSYNKPNTTIRKRLNYQECVSIRYHDARVARKLDAIYHCLAKAIGP